MKNICFINVNTIKERSALHSNVDDKLILPEILTAQDMYILPSLGSALYERLQSGIENNNLTTDEVDLLDNFITNALVYYTLSELPVGLSYQFYNKGLIRKTSDNTDTPSMQDIIDVANRYRTRAEFYTERLIKHLKQVSSTTTKFHEYVNYGSGVDIVKPERDAYKASIWLGDDYGSIPMSFEERYQGENGLC
jgi:hypothetical protein